MARVLVLGYGNPLRCDDSLGWQVAVQLFRANISPDVEVLPCHQLTPELAESVSRAEVVLFVDCRRDGIPGEFYCEDLCQECGPIAFTHNLSPSALLDLSSELYGSCPKAYLVSICGESFEAGESLSPAVERKLPELKARVRELIADALGRSMVAH
jgi:hydrogenase maturation protease